MAEVGSAYVTLLPSLRGFTSTMQRQLTPQLNRFAREGERAGEAYGGAMSRHMQRLMSQTQRDTTAGMSRHMQELMGQTQRQAEQGGDRAGSGFASRFSGVLGRFSRSTSQTMGNSGAQAGQQFGDRFTRDAAGRLQDGSVRFAREGERAGGMIGGGMGSAMLSAINPSIVSIGAGITGLVTMAKTAIQTLDDRSRSAITFSAVLNIDDSDADAFVRKIAKLDQLLPATASDLNAVATRFATFGKGADDVYKMTEAFAKAASATGSSSEEMVRAAVQVGQSMSTGALKYMDWKIAMPSIAGLAPKFQAEIEKELGIPFQKALDDKVITPEVFSTAIQKVAGSPQIAAGMDKMSTLFMTHWASAMGQFQQKLADTAAKYRPQLLAITDALGTLLQGSAHTFDVLVGVVARLVDLFTAVAGPVAAWAADNRELVGTLKVAVGIFAGVTVGAWALSGGLAAARAGFVLLGNAVKANWVTLAVAALAAGIYLLWQRSETFRRVVTSTWNALRDGVTRAWAAAGPIIEKLRDAFTDVMSILTKGDYTGGLSRAFGIEEDSGVVDVLFRVRDTFLTVRDAIASGIDTLRGKFAEIMNYLGPGLSWAGEQFAATWGSFKGILSGLWGLVKSVFVDAILPTFEKVGTYLRNSLWPTIQTVFANLSPVFELLGRVAVGAIGLLILGFRGLMAVVNAVVIPVFQWLWSNILAPVFGWVVDFVVSVALPALGGALEGVTAVLGFVATAVLWLWDNALKPAFTWMWSYLTNTLAPVLMWWWTTVVSPVFSAIGTAATWLWNNVLQPAFQGLATFVVQVLAPALLWLWTNVVSPVFSWIADKVALAWNVVIKPALAALWAYIQSTLIPTIQNFWPIVRAVWDNFSGKVSSAWATISGVFDRLKAGVQAVKSTFETVTNAIGTVWESMKGKVEAPVKFVVNSIVRDKLVAGWNAVAGKVGLPTWDFKGYARGGWTGPGGKYDPAGIVHADEFVVRKESRGSIEREAPGLLDALNRYGAAALNRLAPGYADGGQVGKVQLFLQKLLSRRGGRYVLGASHGPREWANPNQMVFDCSGLQLWGMTQVGIPHKGGVAATLGRGNPQIGVSKAMSTPGAFLYRTSNPSAGTSGHIAASLGNGKTIEARGRAYGVGSWGAAGRFEGGSIHPGLSGSLSAAEQAALADAMASAGSGWSLPNAAAMVAHGLVNPFFEAAKALITGMVGTLGDTDAVKLAGGFGTKSVGMVQDFINKTIDRVFPALDFGGAATGGGDAGDDAPGGSVRDIVRQVAAGRGWGSGPQWDALSWIIQHESGWNPKAQNPTSTAYGLFQLLNGTWAGTGYAKSSDPRIQALAGLAYIRNRYASPLGAKAFWQSHGWYADGGWVKPVLFDTGGILPPGVHLVENKTGKPETIRTFEQERTVQQRLTGGDTINVHVGQVRSPDDVDAIERVLRQRDIRNRARARVMAVA